MNKNSKSGPKPSKCAVTAKSSGRPQSSNRGIEARKEAIQRRIFEACNFGYDRYGTILPAALIIRVAQAIVPSIPAKQDCKDVLRPKFDNLALQVECLQECTMEAAKKAFPFKYGDGRLNENLVDYVLEDVLTLYLDLVWPAQPNPELDTFADVVWPAMKLRLAVELETTVSVDASRLEIWLRKHPDAATGAFPSGEHGNE
jgi:hypothetical protein